MSSLQYHDEWGAYIIWCQKIVFMTCKGHVKVGHLHSSNFTIHYQIGSHRQNYPFLLPISSCLIVETCNCCELCCYVKVLWKPIIFLLYCTLNTLNVKGELKCDTKTFDMYRYFIPILHSHKIINSIEVVLRFVYCLYCKWLELPLLPKVDMSKMSGWVTQALIVH